jgi:pimeloyl-ACP methyl ester carboxylesterase
MTFVFEEFELDPARRELRADGTPQALQPQVFDLLLYLVEHRERVVPKQELLEALWPDAIVTESSLQRAVSLARGALGDSGPALIQTYPRQGYRFVGHVKADDRTRRRAQLRPRYAQSGDVHVAFMTLGDGEHDIVLINGWILPMRAMFQHPDTQKALEELSEVGRVITFDKRGTGLSDRVKDSPAHEQRMDDLRAVLGACASEKPVLVGVSEGGALAMLYAATYPERVRGLVLVGAFARMTTGQGHPCGYAPEEMDRLKSYIRGGWGKGASLRPIAPADIRKDPEFLDWVAFAEQEGASPGGALEFLEMNMQIDLRVLLPTIRVPTVVLQVADDKMIDPGNGRYLAERIPNARYIEAPGSDHVFYFRTRAKILEAIEWVLEQEPEPVEEDRFLSTVLAASSPVAESEWSRLVRRYRGRVLSDGTSAHFDGPIRALQCGLALASAAGGSYGVHAGALVRRGNDVTGDALDLAQSVASRAPAGSVWTSRILVDLVPGSDLEFESTGETVGVQDREIDLFSVGSES